jgi:hypothetical protein
MANTATVRTPPGLSRSGVWPLTTAADMALEQTRQKALREAQRRTRLTMAELIAEGLLVPVKEDEDWDS